MPDSHAHNALPVGAMVQEYRVVQVLGTGSFGIVYKAENVYLDEVVAIKEFLPTDLAFRSEGTRVVPLSSDTEESYAWALKHFLREAQILWNLSRPARHPNIIRVSRFHEGNGTAYMVMDFEAGEPLSRRLGERDPRGEAELRSRPLTEQELAERTVPEPELRAILEPLLDGLERVHADSVWHRDIKPANILIREDGSPVLIDFGAARQERADRARSVMAMYSPAYAAPEQVLAMGEQGPWTDIYALGATLYRAVAGRPPTGASERALGAAHEPATRAGAGRYSPTFLAAIDAAIALQPGDRPQSIAEWRRLFAGTARVAAPAAPETERTLILPSRAAPTGPTPEASSESLAVEAILPMPAQPPRHPPKGPATTTAGRRPWLWALPVAVIAAGALLLVLRPGPAPRPSAPPLAPSATAPAPEPSAGVPSTEEIIAQLHGPARPTSPELPATPPPQPEATIVRLEPAPPARETLAPAATGPAPPPGPAVVSEAGPATPALEGRVASLGLPPAVPPAFDPVAIAGDVERALAAFDCAILRSSVTPDQRILVSGYVAHAADVGRVRAVLQDIPQVTHVVADVGVLERPLCELLQVVEARAAPGHTAGRGPRLELNHASGTYEEGELLVVDATAGDAFDGYLYVVYVDSAGTLVHMLPSPSRTGNAVRAGQKVILGADGSASSETMRQYEIVPPHGRSMVVALQSRRPLFDATRPEVEELTAYLPALGASLGRLDATGRSGDVLATSAFLTTRP